MLRIKQKQHSKYIVVHRCTLSSLRNAVLLHFAHFSVLISYFIKLEDALLSLFPNTVKSAAYITYNISSESHEIRALFVPLR